ncbi:hypothetical protein AVL62_15105 [Serinicoccus chungangensis]|uniref:Uncharacterized protein n=2 Tax=Serinicoccus chungangensis TaxID=767452 RepID=A0A0W8IAY5_9MICO|nr:hypothetical protein AVL62_15105 [Serinicoccus chungangensis]
MIDEALPGSFAEDYDFMIRLLQAGHVSIVEEALVTIRWGQSLFAKDWATIVRAIDYLIAKHEIFSKDRRALARLYGQRGFAEAAMGNRSRALRDVWRTVRLYPLEKRTSVTLPVVLGLISPERVMHWANERGRGI